MPKVRRRAGRRQPYRHRYLIRSRPNRVTFLLNTQADISPERRQPQSDDRPAHVAHFTAAFYTLVQELALPAQSLGFPNPLMCPIFVVWDVGDYQIASCNWVLITTSDRLPP